MNYELLQTAFTAAAVDDAAFLTAYNADTVTTWQYVPMATVLNSILKNGVWDKLDIASRNEAYPEELRQKIRKFLTTISSNIETLAIHDAEPETNLPILVSVGIVTQADADEFIDLAKVMTSQALIDQGRAITQTDLNVMRLQGKITTAQTQLDSLNQQASVYSAALQQLWQGVDVELSV
jgi:hypothetical protein